MHHQFDPFDFVQAYHDPLKDTKMEPKWNSASAKAPVVFEVVSHCSFQFWRKVNFTRQVLHRKLSSRNVRLPGSCDRASRATIPPFSRGALAVGSFDHCPSTGPGFHRSSFRTVQQDIVLPLVFYRRKETAFENGFQSTTAIDSAEFKQPWLSFKEKEGVCITT